MLVCHVRISHLAYLIDCACTSNTSIDGWFLMWFRLTKLHTTMRGAVTACLSSMEDLVLIGDSNSTGDSNLTVWKAYQLEILLPFVDDQISECSFWSERSTKGLSCLWKTDAGHMGLMEFLLWTPCPNRLPFDCRQCLIVTRILEDLNSSKTVCQLLNQQARRDHRVYLGFRLKR